MNKTRIYYSVKQFLFTFFSVYVKALTLKPGKALSYQIKNEFCEGARVSQVALVVKNSPANEGDMRDSGLTTELRRFPRGGHSNPLQYSCLENPMDRRSCRATVHGRHKESDMIEATEHTGKSQAAFLDFP